MSRELRHLKTLDEARKILWEALPARVREGRFGVRPVEIAEALGLVLDEEIPSPTDLPPFDRSLMDGYALRAQDTFGASEGLPAYLKLVGEVQMGDTPAFALSHNQAARIATGGMLPEGADAVVMVEYTQPWGDDSIEVLRPVAPGDHVVRRADDVREGQAILPAGHRLRPQDISALAGLGVTTVPVRLPRVAVLSTGPEIVPHTDPVSPGKIRDMNGPALRAAIRSLGAEPLNLGLVTDEEEPLRDALRRGLAEADIVLASGGTSVGAADLMPDIISSLGTPGVLVHGVAVKPGKPVVIGLVDETPIFGLPGHPTSCLLIFRELVAPLLRAAGGARAARPRPVRALLSRNYPSQAGREEFVPVRLEEREGEWHATPLLGPSALISTLVKADGLVCIPAEAEGLYAGDSVDVEPLE
ncbi:MAG: molybdopterin molybdotransferase MoeA [Armatimonadota bacterium]|nr:MAG: molybdopterin molybdotransferase MoeA [Armatimonadota bacterium]